MSIAIVDLTTNTSTPVMTVGMVWKDYKSDKTYMYVQAASDTTVADGTVLNLLQNAAGKYVKCSSDYSDCLPGSQAAVGIGAITADYYGWVQIGGYHDAIITNADDDIAAGNLLITGTDGVCDSNDGSATDSTDLVTKSNEFAVATTADVDAADTVAGYIDCRIA